MTNAHRFGGAAERRLLLFLRLHDGQGKQGADERRMLDPIPHLLAGGCTRFTGREFRCAHFFPCLIAPFHVDRGVRVRPVRGGVVVHAAVEMIRAPFGTRTGSLNM